MNYTFTNSLYERMYGCMDYNECCQDDCEEQEVYGNWFFFDNDMNKFYLYPDKQGFSYRKWCHSDNIICKNTLTKEWLDENCLVTKVYSKLSNKGYLCNVGEGTECALDICQDKNYECSEYKCGDYTVEVLR